MKKFMAYYFIYRTTKNPLLAAQIYQMIYLELSQPYQNLQQSVVGTSKSFPTNVTKKEELLTSLDYLKSKTLKTKKDKESINVIESILQNM